ncbi:hypothetical protein ACIQGZ_00030 [Streptomyces sp. NPDC092296]|uniref:hypothetical protein n=1 Tax=Streptomyces sp. NPDC092296 TaxID=3366012 RepID=UPI0037FFCCBC
MRNRRFAAVITGALLAGSLTAGAGVALATADRDTVPVPAPVAPTPGAEAPAAPGTPADPADPVGPATSSKFDPAVTVDALGTLGDVTRGVRDLVGAARNGAGIDDVRQSASALGSAAAELLARTAGPAGRGGPSAAHRDTDGSDAPRATTIEDALSALRQDVQALLAAVRASDADGVPAAIEAIARDTVDLVRTVVLSLDTPRPADIPAA